MLLTEAVSLCSLCAEQLLNCHGGAKHRGCWMLCVVSTHQAAEGAARIVGPPRWDVDSHTVNAIRDSAMQTHKWLICLSDRADRCCCRVCKTTHELMRLHRPAPALQLHESSSLQAAETAVLDTSRAR